MSEIGDSSKAKQIKGLLGVLGAGLAAGIFIALFMLYYYNPAGSYLAKNVLLTPDNAYSLRYVEPGLKAKSEGRYIFEGIYFSYYDSIAKQMRSIPVTKEKYSEFYYKIANDESLVDPHQDIQSLFNKAHPAVLALKMRSIGEDSSKGIGSTFSTIEFDENGDHYRIQLRQSAPDSGWVYFYHPAIYKEALSLFNIPPSGIVHD